MKVCLLTNEYPPHVYGGAGVHVTHLASELARLMEVSVLCFGEQNETSDHLTVKGIPTPGIPLEGLPEELRPVFAAFHRNLEALLPGSPGDLIHCHTWYSHFAGVLGKIAYGVPLVVTTHSLEPLRPWKREQLGRGYDLSCWVEREALSAADAVIAVSEDTRRDLLRIFGLPPEKIHVIPNGIDISRFKPVRNNAVLEKFGIDPVKPYLLFVGRVTRQKGILHLLDAIPHLNAEVQVVLLAGAPDTPQIRSEVENQVRTLQSRRKGIFWVQDMLPLKELVPIYTGAAVFCCPSIYEPFGIINLEAMACGTPVVGTRIGGIQEIILQGETGLLVPVDQENDGTGQPRDGARFAADLAAAVNRIIADDGLREAMGRASIQRVTDHYQWSQIARRTHALYLSLLENTGNVRRPSTPS